MTAGSTRMSSSAKRNLADKVITTKLHKIDKNVNAFIIRNTVCRIKYKTFCLTMVLLTYMIIRVILDT